ncbi:hypothetical protein GHT06_003745 [Daphnia sinensis]|uniref:Uncharacterized protein n=1 Tax=Daphnia sinensis TaxID=1820382 RepID=A0AAD5KDM0_9CRUS|nr:hypothetical protein GHT06_003745 [Daphnia sinensis]
MDSAKIFIMYYKEGVILPLDDWYEPLFCGQFPRKNELPFLKDDIGEHISDKNEFYKSWHRVLAGNVLYANNMFILKNDRYDEFMSWWFTMLFAFEKEADLDSYQDYQRRILGKYTDFVLSNPREGKNIRYIPSSGVNVGIGVTYQKFTINLGFPIDIFNPSRQKDFPDLLDLQSHIYTTKWMIDFFGQFYTGYTIPESSKTDYSMLREDMKVRKLGILAGYILKGEQISLQAASQQSAIQKRSAFSPLVGFEAYRVLVKGDSLIFPMEENIETNFIRSDYFHFGPNAGLVGSLVFGKGFFITGALIANLGAGYSRWDKQKKPVSGK